MMGKYNFLILLLVIFLITSTEMQAQEVRKRSVKIEDRYEDEPNEEYEFDRFAVKLNPLLAAIGDFPISLEYAVLDWLSVEGGIGITTKNYLSSAMDEYIFPLEDPGVPMTGHSFLYNIKIIPSGDVFDDAFYIGLQYNYRKYRAKFSVPTGQLGVAEDFINSVTQKDIGVTYGYYYLTDIDGLIIDSYVGFAFRDQMHHAAREVYDPTTGLYHYEMANYKDSETMPFTFLLGIKVGYNF